jgi:glycosyltransferase involved in cell wall biosynthesis
MHRDALTFARREAAEQAREPRMFGQAGTLLQRGHVGAVHAAERARIDILVMTGTESGRDASQRRERSGQDACEFTPTWSTARRTGRIRRTHRSAKQSNLRVRNRRTTSFNYSRIVAHGMWARARTANDAPHTLVDKPIRHRLTGGELMRVAIVHDWLVAAGGAEKVLEQIIECFPDADLFSVVDFLEDRRPLGGKPVTTSFIQSLPFARRSYRAYLPLMPLAVEQFDLAGYDLIITSSYALAKGVLVGPRQTHMSFVHSPMRYAWDLQHQYLRDANLTQGPKSWAVRALLHYVRDRDSRAANSVDRFIASSQFVARCVMKTCRRDAAVISPPVDVHAFELCTHKDDFYLTASRMVPYKRIDLIVETFNATPYRKLIVIGDGPEMAAINAKAGPNVTILGHQSFEVLKHHLQRARAFVLAAEEDFGSVALEAQACGTPVIAFGKGGALETVVPIGEAHPTGVYFACQTVVSMLDAIDRFERQRDQITPAACRANAERFSAAVFRRAFMAEVTRTIAAAGLRHRLGTVTRIEDDLATRYLRWPGEPAQEKNLGR